MVLILIILVIAIAGLSRIFPQSTRRLTATTVENLFLRYQAWGAGTGSFLSGAPSKQEIMAPLRDGVQLATDLYLPRGKGPFPAIAIRSPYNKADGRPFGEFFARYGYAVAIQDVRGRYASEGEFYPFRHEIEDGIDFTRWLKAQPWCNGKIGAFGGSYLGYTQWAMAVGNPDLASFAPAIISADLYDGIYRGGAFGKLTFLHWCLTSYGRYGDGVGAKAVGKGYDHFPLVESDDAALKNISFYDDWVRHPVPEAYWRELDLRRRIPEIRAPALLTAGWYDFFLEGQLNDFTTLQRAADPVVRGESKILIGPWNHAFFNGHQRNYGIRQRKFEILPFKFIREIKDWYDHSLKGAENGWDKRPPVRLYVLGKNEWKDLDEWPPARAEFRSFYLHSGGNAQTLGGGGTLDPAVPVEHEPSDLFVFDPRQPVPTHGGAHGAPADCGPADQRQVERRTDVLVYSSAPLEHPLLVMGRVEVRLFASSSAKDTDFTAKLVDVFPDSQAVIVCEGLARARYRNGLHRAGSLEPGKTYAFDIHVGSTAVWFDAGHRIRLEISSSNFPRYDANPNTGTEIATERAPVPATQTVAHRREFPSALILPVVPD
jgi:putative CocE/NonD family hydrolase